VITGSEKRNSLATAAAWNTLSSLWGIALVFLATPVLVSHLGTEHYGLYMLLLALAGTLSVLNLGLGDATLRYVAYYHGRNDLTGVNRVVGATLAVYLVTAIIGTLGLSLGAKGIADILALGPADAELGPRLVRLTALLFAFSLVGSVFVAIPHGLQRYDVASKLSLFQTTMQTGGGVSVVLLGYGIEAVLSWSIMLAVSMLVIYGIVVKRLLPDLQLVPRPTQAALREVFGYGAFALLTQMLGIIWAQADKLLLGTLVSAASVGFLSVPQNVAFRGMGLVAQLGAALFPRFATLDDPEAKQALFLRSVWILLAVSVTIYVPLTVLFPELLRLWLNEAFAAQSGWVGQVIAFSCIVRGAFIPYEMLFKGTGKPQYLSVLYLLTGLTGLIVNATLIPQFGLKGAGYAYVITPVWGLLALYFAWRVVLAAKSRRPLLRATLVPLCAAGFLLLVGGHVVEVVRPLSWYGLLALAALGFTSTAGVVIACDMLIEGGGSHMKAAMALFPAIKRARN
jgi:O-antigen/teichoic acid export membrane protein